MPVNRHHLGGFGRGFGCGGFGFGFGCGPIQITALL
jgi:hypothetical protein